MRRLSDRVAVITGAASGIGRALAGRFAAEGMRCVLADIDDSALEEAVRSCDVPAPRPCPDEALDMAGQQLRWMSANVPLEPGPGVARTADARPAPRVP